MYHSRSFPQPLPAPAIGRLEGKKRIVSRWAVIHKPLLGQQLILTDVRGQ